MVNSRHPSHLARVYFTGITESGKLYSLTNIILNIKTFSRKYNFHERL